MTSRCVLVPFVADADVLVLKYLDSARPCTKVSAVNACLGAAASILAAPNTVRYSRALLSAIGELLHAGHATANQAAQWLGALVSAIPAERFDTSKGKKPKPPAKKTPRKRRAGSEPRVSQSEDAPPGILELRADCEALIAQIVTATQPSERAELFGVLQSLPFAPPQIAVDALVHALCTSNEILQRAAAGVFAVHPSIVDITRLMDSPSFDAVQGAAMVATDPRLQDGKLFTFRLDTFSRCIEAFLKGDASTGNESASANKQSFEHARALESIHSMLSLGELRIKEVLQLRPQLLVSHLTQNSPGNILKLQETLDGIEHQHSEVTAVAIVSVLLREVLLHRASPQILASLSPSSGVDLAEAAASCIHVVFAELVLRLSSEQSSNDSRTSFYNDLKELTKHCGGSMEAFVAAQHIPSTLEALLHVALIRTHDPFTEANIQNLTSGLQHWLWLANSGVKLPQRDRLFTPRLPSVEQAQKALLPHVFGLIDVVSTNHLGLSFEVDTQAPPPVSLFSVRHGLRMLRLLLLLLGKNVIVIGKKVPSILELIGHLPLLVDDVASIWETFVETIPSTDFALEHGAATAVEVLGLERTHTLSPTATAHLTNALATLRRKSRSGQFWRTFDAALRPTSSLLTSAASTEQPTDPPTHQELLEGYVEGLESMSSTCRRVFLEALHSHLVASPFASLISVSELAQRSRLVPCLLRCCREPPTNKLALKCLGMIGAVRLITNEKEISGKSVNIEYVMSWDSFAHELLRTYCVRALSFTSDCRMHDRAAYAVQTLIRLCTNEERQKKKSVPLADTKDVDEDELAQYAWWSKLTPSTQSALSAFITTQFATKILYANDRKVPEYQPGLDFVSWIQRFFLNLVSRSSGVHGKIFQSVRNVAKRDSTLMTFLLPYVLINVILEGTEQDLVEIAKEFEIVLDNYEQAEEHCQQIFNLVDDVHLLKEHLEQRKVTKQDSADAHSARNVDLIRDFLLQIGNFLRRIDPPRIIKASIGCRCCARALKYIEATEVLPSLETCCATYNLVDVQSVFAQLDDFDSVKCLHKHLPSEDWARQALSYELSGEWEQALQCCEIILQHTPSSVDHQRCALRCLQQLGQLDLMLRFVPMQTPSTPTAAAGGTSNEGSPLAEYAAEAAWRLGRWEYIRPLETFPNEIQSIGEALKAIRDVTSQNSGVMTQSILHFTENESLRVNTSLLASYKEDYQQCHIHLVRLHALADLAFFSQAVDRKVHGDGNALASVDELLEKRLNNLDYTPQSRELVIALHRSMFQCVEMEDVVARKWLQHAKLLCVSGFFEAALNAVRQSTLCGRQIPSKYYTRHAKILYSRGLHPTAIAFAERHAADSSLDAPTRAKLLQLATSWGQETGTNTPNETIRCFRQALAWYPEFEKGHFSLGMFYEKLYRSACSGESDAAMVTAAEQYATHIMNHFGTALRTGTRTVFLSLPRLLTRWLDCAEELSRSPSKAKAAIILQSVNVKADSLFLGEHSIPAGILVAALPQLVSRLGHSNKDVIVLLARIMQRLLEEFPQQCLWALLPTTKTLAKQRASIVQTQILQPFCAAQKAKQRDTGIVECAQAVFACLIDICTCTSATLEKEKLFSLSSVRHVAPKLASFHFLLPVSCALTPNIPRGSGAPTSTFASSPAFHKFDEVVKVMPSLQKPKKIGVLDKSGVVYHFLCKSKDEPRKDMRLMELASMLNMLFVQMPESRRHNLQLRRYHVAALTDDCAIIEWVENTVALRKTCEDLYAVYGKGLKMSHIRALKTKCDAGQFSQLELLETHLLPPHPPILHLWLHATFPRPQQWYGARQRFTRSCAAWSMVGHVIGLGDRHGENLLLEATSGEIVHVDFACLFDKGETMDVPERVRFRLTPNVVDAMGITGVNGPFRRCSELALLTQVKHKEAIMGILETFIHDPLVEWVKYSSKSDPKALVGRASRRLDGYLDLFGEPRDTLALSVEAQVEKLIASSVSHQALSMMYIWWMPWI